MTPTPPPLPPPAYYGQRIALFYAGYFILTGVSLPFFPVWLEARGLTAAGWFGRSPLNTVTYDSLKGGKAVTKVAVK